MSLLEQESFIKGIPPFDMLNVKNLRYVCENLDVVYFKENEVLLSKGMNPEFLYFIIKGVVQETHENEVVSIYDHHEAFDAISLIENHVKREFITGQETICYVLPREIFLEVLHEDENFEQYFFQSISQKLNTNQINEKNKELANFMVARVEDAYIKTPVIVDDKTSIFDAISQLKEKKSSSLLVRRGDSLGIVTDTDYRDKLILKNLSSQEPIDKLATYNVITVSSSEFLFNAQLKMTEYGIKRLVVIDENQEILGVLDQISLASFFASHTYAISNEIERADSVETLRKASENLIRVTKALYAKGVKVRYISKLLSQLNEKVFKKLFDLTAPTAIRENAALIVMGSEGRREQILKTDQDNALILREDCTCEAEELKAFTEGFTQMLLSFGYPKCPGNIMISNPEWVKTEEEFKNILSGWVQGQSSEDLMNLAIFYDAVSVAGDETLLAGAKNHLLKRVSDNARFFAYFAHAVLTFETPLSIFSGFVLGKNDHKDALDIKKGGIFAIVHGVRSLALENRLEETNSVERLKKLNNLGVIDRELTGDLIESFNFLLTLLLKYRLKKIEKNLEPDNYVKPSALTKIERDLLKDSFKTVDKFKKFLTFHYKLNMLG